MTYFLTLTRLRDGTLTSLDVSYEPPSSLPAKAQVVRPRRLHDEPLVQPNEELPASMGELKVDLAARLGVVEGLVLTALLLDGTGPHQQHHVVHMDTPSALRSTWTLSISIM